MLSYTEWKKLLNKADEMLREINMQKAYRALQICGTNKPGYEDEKVLQNDAKYRELVYKYQTLTLERDYIGSTGEAPPDPFYRELLDSMERS